MDMTASQKIVMQREISKKSPYDNALNEFEVLIVRSSTKVLWI